MADDPLDPLADEQRQDEADDPQVLVSGLIIPDDPILEWERQPGETARQFHAFCHYRDLQVDQRSLPKAWAQHMRTCMGSVSSVQASRHWRAWAVRWGWSIRALRWDDELDRQFRVQHGKEQNEARARHARFAQATLSVLTVPVRAALEAAKDPQLVEAMTAYMRRSPAHALQVLAGVARIVAAAPAFVQMERQALGLGAVMEAGDDQHDAERGIADQIIADPAATELAVELLNRLAHARADAALGAGSAGQQGKMAPSPAFEPVDEEVGGSGG